MRLSPTSLTLENLENWCKRRLLKFMPYLATLHLGPLIFDLFFNFFKVVLLLDF